jgi:hypothetical protein
MVHIFGYMFFLPSTLIAEHQKISQYLTSISVSLFPKNSIIILALFGFSFTTTTPSWLDFQPHHYFRNTAYLFIDGLLMVYYSNSHFDLSSDF